MSRDGDSPVWLWASRRGVSNPGEAVLGEASIRLHGEMPELSPEG